jgi:hypothetical protein
MCSRELSISSRKLERKQMLVCTSCSVEHKEITETAK